MTPSNVANSRHILGLHIQFMRFLIRTYHSVEDRSEKLDFALEIFFRELENDAIDRLDDRVSMRIKRYQLYSDVRPLTINELRHLMKRRIRSLAKRIRRIKRRCDKRVFELLESEAKRSHRKGRLAIELDHIRKKTLRLVKRETEAEIANLCVPKMAHLFEKIGRKIATQISKTYCLF